MSVHQGDTELNRIRVDHVGGLPRPAWLRGVQLRFEEGTLSAEELEAEQRRAVGAIIARQEELGLPIVTDGEFTRHNFQESFGGAVSGFDATPARYARRADVEPAAAEAAPTADSDAVPTVRAPSGMSEPGPRFCTGARSSSGCA
jgi:5-methyltetrahydropteroyltriglutamate--homocysteine methyltransferase